MDHHDLRLISRHGAAFGDNVNQVLIFPSEYIEIQRHYPIFFRQTEAGGFKSVALLGFDKDENLFLEGDRWHAAYVPAMQRMGPFLIGQPKAAPGETLPPDAGALILVDTDHPRLSRDEGEPLFRAQGGQSATLTEVTRTLHQIYAGSMISDGMFAAFHEAGLLAPVEIEVKVGERQSYILKDMLTVSGEALHKLDADHLKALNDAGFLSLAFAVVSSMSNLGHLIDLKTSRGAVAAA